jgi:signal transduction histidine kinase
MAVRGLVAAAGLSVGIVSVGAGYGWDTPRLWVPDLLTGMAFVIAGVAVLLHRPRPGLLLVGCGLAWFAVAFWPGALFLHRGPLVHLLLTAPGARPENHLVWVAITAGYVAGAFPTLWGTPLGSLLLSTSLVILTVHRAVTAPPQERRARVAVARTAVAVALVIVSGAVLNLVLPAGAAAEPVLLAYEAVLVWTAVTLAIVNRPQQPDDVTDLVVELGDPEVLTLEQRLAATVGDPNLRLGVWTDGRGYLDSAGEPVVVDDDHRVATPVDLGGEPFALLVHDRSVLADPVSRDAVATATRLLVRNEALRTEALAEVAELDGSRRRLLAAGEEERRRVDHELRSGVGRRLDQLDRLLESAASDGVPSEHLERAREHLASAKSDLDRIARLLRPPELRDGLPAALKVLAARSPVPVEVRVEAGLDRLPVELGVTAFYVCTEGLSNVAKHAGASSVTVTVSRTGEILHVAVEDDGVGPDSVGPAGSGLTNLRYRAAAVGGRVRLTRTPGGGARLVAELPLDHQV